MSSSGEEEDTGPSVDSADPEERIAARRLRIQRRREAQRRAQLGEDVNEKKEVKEELGKSRLQMEASRNRLTKLQDDATEFVTNIRVAAHAREAARRIEEEEGRRQRRERLEAEAKAGTEKFEEITRKWESSLQKEIPQDLHEMLMQQKASCDAMIDEKNKLINDFQVELKGKDDQYVKDLKKQAEDIDLMIERMKEQVKNLMKAYKEEYNQVERAFIAERTELFEGQKKKWEQNMQNRRDKEEEYMRAREKRVEDYEQQLQHLRVQDAEEYNMVKIKLETDVQILEQQLQQMRATYQLNQEKLEYNFQVLKKRDEENTITKSQQKRKITRLQDVLTNLKIKLAKQEKNFRDENQQLTEDYKRITEQFKELQKKSKHFMSTDSKKFHDVWVMNEDEAKELVNKVMEEDRIIHEHQLGMNWNSPDMTFMENKGPLVAKKGQGSGMSAHEFVQEVMSQAESDKDEPLEGQKSLILQKFSPKLVKQILELLCDETGFLIENKLNKLLQPLERDEQSLMKLDAIFSALKVETEDDIHLLAQYFLHLIPTDRSTAQSLSRRSTGVGPSQVEQVEESSSSQQKADEEDEDEADREVAQVTGRRDEGEEPVAASARQEGQDLVHPNEVLKALRKFVEDNRQPPKEKGRQAQFQIAMLEERDDKDDAGYWAKYPAVLSEQTERLWDALLEGLEKYSETLTSRSTLITETDALRQQNTELRMLLHQYINSKVNQELEIPPTRILQLELNQA